MRLLQQKTVYNRIQTLILSLGTSSLRGEAIVTRVPWASSHDVSWQGDKRMHNEFCSSVENSYLQPNVFTTLT